MAKAVLAVNVVNSVKDNFSVSSLIPAHYIFIVVACIGGWFIFKGARLLREARKLTAMAGNLEMDLTSWNPQSKKSILDALKFDPVMTQGNIDRWKHMKAKEIVGELKTLANYRRDYANGLTLKAMIRFVLASFTMSFGALLVSLLQAGGLQND